MWPNHIERPMPNYWPVSSDYSEAVQMPDVCCSDPDLKAAKVATLENGLPKPPCAGNFADVYQFRSRDGQRQWAVKCFTRPMARLNERYREISKQLEATRLPFTVEFKYLEHGMRIRGEWYPVVKMDWVEGLTLRQFVTEYLSRPGFLKAFFPLWLKMLPLLREAGVAHGDLQHGNVMLVPGSSEGKLALRLIDYDGMWVRSMAGQPPSEVGHPCFQHPQRAKQNLFSPDIDRFPHLVIACALRCLVRPDGMRLWKDYDNGDNLLFTKQDFDAPSKSKLLHELWNSGDGELQAWVGHLVTASQAPLESTPQLSKLVIDGRMTPLSDAAEKSIRSILGPATPVVGTELKSGAETDWWNDELAESLTEEPADESARLKQEIDEAVRRKKYARLAPLVIRYLKLKPNAPKMERLLRDLAKNRPARAVANFKGHRRYLDVAGRLVEPKELALSVIGILALFLGVSYFMQSSLANRAPANNVAMITPDPASTPARLIKNSIEMELVLIKPGEFLMGASNSEAEAQPSEKPQHRVQITQPFYMGKYEVTQAEYQQVMGTNPSYFTSSGGGTSSVADQDTRRFPVEQVSWNDAVDFCNELSERDGLTVCYDQDRQRVSDRGYRLPTEAEWEFACRAGTTTPFHFDSVVNGDKANVNGNSPYGTKTKGAYLGRTTVVDDPTYPPNAFGLAQMHGNVWEWCEDVYDAQVYAGRSGVTTDPVKTSGWQYRVLRGGAWGDNPWSARSALRDGDRPVGRSVSRGFRVVCSSGARTQ